MAYPKEEKHNFWSWMLFNADKEAKESNPTSGNQIKKAVKCDMCKDVSGGPACVRACPTGAANRVSPENFIKVVNT
jgi:Fe-S-cluster-containing hydrogenase component 2